MSELVADESESNQRNVLQLDARRREMLELMGVRLWWPEAKAQPPQQAQVPPASVKAVPVAPVAPVPQRVEPQAVAAERLPAARTGAGAGEGLLADAPRLLFGQDGPGGWLIVADMPPDMLGGYPAPLAGDEGRLLANMLRALRLDAGEVPVHLMRVHRGSATSGDNMPRPLQDVLGPQAGPLTPRVVLALGPLAAQALLQRAGPIGKLRGEALPLPEGPLEGTPAVASYPLAYLLRNGADKAKAWADLCQAAAAATR